MSRPMVHPQTMEVEGPAVLLPVGQQPGVRMDDVPGKPGTFLGLGLRCVQFGCAAITLVVMASTNFRTVPSYRFLVAASGLLCLWSIPLAILDIYALSVKRRLRHRQFHWLYTVGDGVMGALMFTAASMSGGITDFIMIGSKKCETNHCTSYVVSTVFAFFSFFAVLLTFLLNLSSWAS